MLRLFAKTKSAVAVVAIVLLAVILFTIGGITIAGSRRLTFPADGYVIAYADGVDSAVSADQIRFTSGTSVTSTTLSSENFLHFDDESISSLGGMTLVNLDRYEAGFMDSYYLEARQILEKDESVYKIDNNSSTLEFENILLKTGDRTYLMASPSIIFNQSNGQQYTVRNGFVEIAYLDESGSAARISDGTDAWQFLTDGASLTMDNGSTLDLGGMQFLSASESSGADAGYDSGTASQGLALSEIEVDLDLNVNIQVVNNSADAWVAPTFLVNPVNGADGASGDDGTLGDNGTSGESGRDGIAGEDGADGEDGSAGGRGAAAAVGGDGSAGRDGDNTDDDENLEDAARYLKPCITISSWSQDAGSFAFSFVPYNMGWTVSDDGVIWFGTVVDEDGKKSLIDTAITKNSLYVYLINARTSKVIGEWKEEDLTGGPNVGITNGQTYTPVTSSISLTPETSYKLIFEGKTKNGKTTLLTRTFQTDANGLYLQKVDSGYIGDDNTAKDYNTRYEEALKKCGKTSIKADAAFLGLMPTLSGRQEIKTIDSVSITYRNLKDGSTGKDNRFDSETQREALAEIANADLIYPLDNLLSNTEYTITITATLISGAQSTIKDTYLTVKQTPSVRCARFDANEGRFFISSLDLTCQTDFDEHTALAGQIDPDGAIAYYRHEVYLYNTETDRMTGNALKTRTTYDTASPSVSFYIGGTLTEGTYYKNRIYVTWFDNERYVTKEVSTCTNSDACRIIQSSKPYIQFDDTPYNGSDAGITTTSIKGRIYVFPGSKSNNEIYVGDSVNHKILLTYNSSSTSGIIEISSLNGWHYVDYDESGKMTDGDLIGTNGLDPTVIPATGAYYEFELDGLKSGTTYTITLEGCMSQTSDTRTQIGSTTIKTLSDEQQ
jgi:hypothetical protein